MLGYLASRPEVVVVLCGAVWGLEERGGDFSWECFYRSRRVTTLEPQDTLAAVRRAEG